MEDKGKKYLYIALIMGLLLHGILIFFTFENTYDAYVHIFFADHYAENWFDHWEYRWYTGFTMVSYPPLVHQLLALLSMIIGLKLGFVLMGVAATLLFIRGVYVFSRLWVREEIAGIASILAVVSSSFIEAIHIFGQLPSVTGIALLLNATPFIYAWIRKRKFINLLVSASFISVITSIHHVTTIFGMVFFVFPVIGLALMDIAIEEKGGEENIRFKDFITYLLKIFKPAIILGIVTIFATLITILPYWLWSRSDPITQVPIPHGSRDSFIEVFSSGLVFFIIPWGMMLFFLPFLFKMVFSKRTIILAISLSMSFLLGTGGTTPIPRMVLGETAFNILTLDRFTYWVTIMSIPFFASFIHSLLSGKYKEFIIQKMGHAMHKVISAFWIGGILLTCVFVINISTFQPLQPKKIEIKPILNFLERDQHDSWRYLTLGFGDQMAWLSANTNALTVDGNYHSVRRLPELTSRKVERLENSKYLGTEGIGALHQFLTVPEKYHLKYVFSNDKFYDPILHFSGWQKLNRLENGIEVWEKPDIPSLPSILPRKDIPHYQQLMWSLIPLTSLSFLILLMLFVKTKNAFSQSDQLIVSTVNKHRKEKHPGLLDLVWSALLLIYIVASIIYYTQVNRSQHTPDNLITAYFDAIDFKEFEKAFSFYLPEKAPSVDQMLLDLSQEDGITVSYAKLNTLSLNTELSDEGARAVVQAKVDWITSIKSYTTFHNFNLVKENGKWWIEFTERDIFTPPDQFFSTPDVEFKNQGRRDARLEGTDAEDILDRPELYINEARLVNNNGQFHIVGQLVNIDNDPAYVTVTATLLDSAYNEIVSYNCREVLIHNLLPKESTCFRVDFEDVAYQVSKTNFPSTFDPEFSTPFNFLSEPAHFILNVKSVVSTHSLYKYYGITDVNVEGEDIQGSFINSGTKECNIPQVLTAYYKGDKMIWVESNFLDRSVRPQRSRRFKLKMPDKDQITIKAEAAENNLLINGRSSRDFYQKWVDIDQKSKDKLLRVGSDYLVDIFPTGYVAQE